MKKETLNNNIFFITLLICLNLSCKKEHKTGSIDIDQTNYKTIVIRENLDELFTKEGFRDLSIDSLIRKESVEFIKLETSRESLLGNLGSVFIEDSSYIVVDGALKNIVKFSKKGKFKQKIGGIGRGPGEYSDNMSAVYNKYNKTVEVYVNPKKIVYNSKSGAVLQESSDLSSLGFTANKFYPCGTDGYAMYNMFSNHLYKNESFRFAFLKNSKLLYQGLPYDGNQPRPQGRYSSNNLFYTFKDTLHFFERFAPIVYTVTETGLKVKYKFNFKSTAGTTIDPLNAIEGLNTPGIRDKSVWLSKVFETDNFLLIESNRANDKGPNWSIVDKRAEKLVGVSSIHPYYLDELKLPLYLKPLADNKVYANVLPTEIIKAQKRIKELKTDTTKRSPLLDKLMALNVDEQDNEILIIIPFK